MIRGLALALCVLFLCVVGTSKPAVAQATCVSPGVILDVPTPGFLKADTPNLVLDFENGDDFIPVSVISQTVSRIRIKIPTSGLVSDGNFKILHVEDDGKTKVVANARTCELSSVGTGSNSARSGFLAGGSQTARARLTPATRFDVVAPSGAPEFVLMGSPGAVSRAEGVVSQVGGTVLRRRGLNTLGLGMAMVDLAGFLSLDELRGELARRGIDIAAGRHNVYSVTADTAQYARSLTGIGTGSTACRLRKTIRVGVIDGPVNAQHPALQGVALETATVLGRLDRSASADHGTGIAGLIASPELGLAPGVSVLAVTAVSRAGTREVAKLEDMAAAIDWLVQRKVNVINMSLAGPFNEALAEAIGVASRRGVILVAAVGNNRRSDVAYPASDPRVIAVTAIDANKRLYRRASRGAAVDFAAPGVDLRVPTAKRTAVRSGTSYASAALTAFIALELANGRSRTLNDIRETLTRLSEDLGPAGRDSDFGIGLPSRDGC